MTGSIIPGAAVSASALSAERARLEVISQNLANMNTTKGADGEVYRRKMVVFEQELDRAQGSVGGGVKVSKIVNDPRPLIRVYMPAHPHADKEGMVTMPNVNMLEEMADMMIATRSYEANLQAIRAGKQMLNGAMEIGAAQ